MQGQRSREREEARDKRAKQQKKQTVAKSKIPVNNETCKHKKTSTRGYTEPTRNQHRQNTEDTIQDPSAGFFTKEKNPAKVRGL